MGAEKMKSEVRKEQIATAALQIIGQHGVKGLTVERAARMVGLVPSAVYRHFRNKSDLLDATLDLLRDRLLANIVAARREAQSPLEAIRQMLLRHVHLIHEYQALPRILFSEKVFTEEPQRKLKLYEIIREFTGHVADVIRQGQDQGQIRRDIAAETLSVMFLGLFQPSAIMYHLSGGTFDMIHQVDATWKIYQDALRPPPGDPDSTPDRS
jgi:AcrR family transcriptional regulator